MKKLLLRSKEQHRKEFRVKKGRMSMLKIFRLKEMKMDHLEDRCRKNSRKWLTD